MNAASDVEHPKCHLHRRPNKACKFCKAYTQWAEEQEKRREEIKSATVEKLRSSMATSRNLPTDGKAPIPNFSSFPKTLEERIPKSDVYVKSCKEAGLPMLIEVLVTCENCDTERKNKITLDFQPSAFICVVYRLLTLQLTDAEINYMMENANCWVRCAAFLYVRLGFQAERCWEALADGLMDDEEFKPFPSRNGEASTITVGEYIEGLLMKPEYGGTETTKLPVPRIPVLLKNKISRRLCLYPQYRERYAANYKIIEEALGDSGKQVEVCSVDGEWRPAITRGLKYPSNRCAAVRVAYDDGTEEHVSIGRIILPDNSSTSSDLSRSRGRNAQDILERHDEQQRDNAFARGKDYCKVTVQTVCIGGVRVMTGDKRGRAVERDEEALTEEQMKSRKQQQEHVENRARLAAIESKYCARVPSSESAPAPDRMRLG